MISPNVAPQYSQRFQEHLLPDLLSFSPYHLQMAGVLPPTWREVVSLWRPGRIWPKVLLSYFSWGDRAVVLSPQGGRWQQNQETIPLTFRLANRCVFFYLQDTRWFRDSFTHHRWQITKAVALQSCSLAALRPACSLTGISSLVAIFCLHNLCWGLPELASCLRFPSLANFTRFFSFFSLQGFAPPSLRNCGWDGCQSLVEFSQVC